ncbi:MAG: acyl--CoA ligase [Lachnospiraceae bacterium]|nr:acyl--CoA ligase [Lachnospiraceae bacterium]
MKSYDKPYRNLYDTLADSARRFPEKVAVIDDEEEITYKKLLYRVDELAAVLQIKYGLKEQEQIGVLMVNSIKTVTAFYAAMKIGCIALMINTKFKEAEIEDLLCSMEVKLILSDSRWLEKVEGVASRLGIETILTEETDFGRRGSELLGSPVLPAQVKIAQNIENTAVIMHTSGTTGRPKGVMVTHRNILEAAYGYQEVQGLDFSAVTVLSVPLFHILGLSCVTTLFIYMGATVILSEFYRVEDVLWKIKKYGATHFHSVPAIFLQMIESDYEQKDLTSLRTAVCGGAPISKENIDRFCVLAPNARLHLAYGMTETAGSGTLSAVHKEALMAVPNVQMKVVDENHGELPPGQIGELVFCGPCIARGRWRSQSLPDDHMYSGDVGYMDEEGHVYVIDRLKDIINRGGEKIFPIEVEDVILQYPGVARAAVYAVSSQEYGEVPAAAIVWQEGATADMAGLEEFLVPRVATYKRPVFLEQMEELPVTQNGKVRKLQLRKWAEERRI